MSWTFGLLMLFTEDAHFCHDWSSSANTRMTFTACWQSIYQYLSRWENLEAAELRENLRNQM